MCVQRLGTTEPCLGRGLRCWRNTNKNKRYAQTARRASQTCCPASMSETRCAGSCLFPVLGFSQSASKAVTSSNYNGEVNWHVPSSTGNRCEITKLILQTQTAPGRNIRPAQLRTCLEPRHLPAGEKLLTSALKLPAHTAHA